LNTPENTDGIQEQQLPQSQVWPRRQEVQQQVLVRPAPIEGVERMNSHHKPATTVAGSIPRHNPYVIEVYYGRNCYSCGSFRHLVRIETEKSWKEGEDLSIGTIRTIQVI